jgi:ABC-type uncharacterized transport system involved in gliding motility auxiliary subunit
VDPYAYFDQQPDLQNPFGGSQAGQSTLYNLFKAWGIDMNLGKVMADLTYASGQGPQILPTLLSLNNQAFNLQDPVMSQVGTLLMPFAGSFSGKPAAGLTETVLAHTSRNAMPVDLIIATLTGEPSTRGFQPTGKEEPLAIRLTGKFKTAFPNGPPKPYMPPGQKKEEPKKDEPQTKQLREGAAENSVVLVADADMLTDGAAVEVQDIFGQKLVVPRNGNLALAEGLVEQNAGDQALMTLRARASFTRPLTVIQKMEAEAQQAYLGKIKQLEDSLQKTQDKLQSLQKGKASAQGTILTPEQQAEIDNFRKQAVQTKQELKDLRRNLRAETDSLMFWTKVINIALVPLLITIVGLALAAMKRRRMPR